jgi:DNA-binding MarR family transcriptional regulator
MGYKVLSMIVARGPVKAGELVDELHTDKSVLSRQVRQLESLGLVESHVDDRDARARLLVATPAAVESVRAVRAQNQAELRARLAAWRPDEVATLAELLSRLAD